MKYLTDTGLYIHIPFCKRKCGYCDFYSLTMYENLIDEYLTALMGDIKERGGHIDRPFDTVYIGGGTPSLLEGRIETLMTTVRESFDIRENAEITVEVNPDVSERFLKAAGTCGANRISIGIQSGSDCSLKLLGRTHNAAAAKETVSRIKFLGFYNISADLMICLPNSSIKTLDSDISFFLDLDIPHISVYMLKIENRTKFGKTLPAGLPDDDAQAEQYLYMCEALEKNGYIHYEISNFAKPGFESKHNLKYWNCEEYLGFGPSAHSFFDGKRFYCPPDIKEYIRKPRTVFDGVGATKEEKLMLGARLKKGIDLSEYLCDNIDRSKKVLSDLEAAKLIHINGNNVALTDRGMLVSNSVIAALLELIS